MRATVQVIINHDGQEIFNQAVAAYNVPRDELQDVVARSMAMITLAAIEHVDHLEAETA